MFCYKVTHEGWDFGIVSSFLLNWLKTKNNLKILRIKEFQVVIIVSIFQGNRFS